MTKTLRVQSLEIPLQVTVTKKKKNLQTRKTSK